MAKISKKAYLIHINAGNDRNGNPQRGWVCYDKDGGFLGFVDEGYSGRQAIRDVFSGPYIELMNNVPVTVSYYKDSRNYEI